MFNQGGDRQLLADSASSNPVGEAVLSTHLRHSNLLVPVAVHRSSGRWIQALPGARVRFIRAAQEVDRIGQVLQLDVHRRRRAVGESINQTVQDWKGGVSWCIRSFT